eukprot:TRINITY_DN52791_c0_g1_i1.p1 TRINITY_DN52791_c0_g1~~TRINITY_DN52791_c0_g1_i1.p1  ORF type:complete len:338 (+),score=57.27 TRINITY_DN52791_c0_g1_i1:23-1015(+)
MATASCTLAWKRRSAFGLAGLVFLSCQVVFVPFRSAKVPSRTARSSGSSATAAPVLTYIGVNTFSLHIGDKRLLVDPLLVGSLIFAGQTWAYKGSRRKEALDAAAALDPRDVRNLFDAVLLSQGLPDHAHPETLKAMDRRVPIIANPSAAKICRQLGFEQVRIMSPGDSMQLGEHLKITALPGSVVGPPWQEPENGWVFSDLREGGLSVGTEPHGNFLGPRLGTSFKMLPQAPPGVTIDALLIPLTRTDIAGYPLVNGVPEALETLKQLQPVPRFVLPLNNTDIDSSGALTSAMSEEGSSKQFLEELRNDPQLAAVRLLETFPGRPISIE